MSMLKNFALLAVLSGAVLSAAAEEPAPSFQSLNGSEVGAAKMFLLVAHKQHLWSLEAERRELEVELKINTVTWVHEKLLLAKLDALNVAIEQAESELAVLEGKSSIKSPRPSLKTAESKRPVVVTKANRERRGGH